MSHPKYPSPQIQEAIVDMLFHPAGGEQEATFVGKYYEQVD